MLSKIVGDNVKMRLLILTTRRPEYLPPWHNPAVVTDLPLEPLPIGDIRQLVRARLGIEALPEALAREITEKAEGNPLFAEEMVRYLTERNIVRIGATELEFDVSSVAAALPTSVQSLLTARVDRLTGKDRALLQAASVIGRQFDPQLLGTTVAEPHVDDRLMALQALDMVYRDDKSHDFVFKHALVRDALYQGLLSETLAVRLVWRRSALHLKIAEEIERRSGNRLIEVAEVLAHHYRERSSDRRPALPHRPTAFPISPACAVPCQHLRLRFGNIYKLTFKCFSDASVKSTARLAQQCAVSMRCIFKHALVQDAAQPDWYSRRASRRFRFTRHRSQQRMRELAPNGRPDLCQLFRWAEAVEARHQRGVQACGNGHSRRGNGGGSLSSFTLALRLQHCLRHLLHEQRDTIGALHNLRCHIRW